MVGSRLKLTSRKTAFGAAILVAVVLPATASAKYTWPERIKAAERYADERAGKESFAVVDERGRLRGRHKGRIHHSASVVKAMFLVAYLRRGDVRDRDLSDDEKRLLEPMIKRSDNQAADAIRARVGDRAVLRLARASGMTRFALPSNWALSEITARDQAGFMYRLERLVPRRHRDYALDLLADIVRSQRWGIPPAAPDGWGLHFKGGWANGVERGWRTNQVALLRRGERRLAAAILVRYAPGRGHARNTIEGIARRLFRRYGRLRD